MATMGRNIARNLASHGFAVAVHNRTTSRMHAVVDEHGDEGTFVGSGSLEDFVASIRKPRAIIVMVKAGEATDAVVEALAPLLDEGDIVVDAGNAHFADTLRRQQALEDEYRAGRPEPQPPRRSASNGHCRGTRHRCGN